MGKVSLFLAIFLLTTVAFSWAIPSNYGGGPSFRFRAAPDDTLGDFFDARARRSANEGGFFSRFIRRTLPFQLIPQPPLAYARASNYVGEPVPVEVDTQEEITNERDYQPKASPKDILNMLENLTKQMDGKARMRYGFF